MLNNYMLTVDHFLSFWSKKNKSQLGALLLGLAKSIILFMQGGLQEPLDLKNLKKCNCSHCELHHQNVRRYEFKLACVPLRAAYLSI